MAENSGWLKGYRAFWVYTLARFALFFVIGAILWAVGVPILFAALIGIVVSVPLSWFLLRKPREAFAATIEARVGQRRERSGDLAKRLEGDAPDGDDPERDDPERDDLGGDLPPGVSESPGRNRSKRR